MDDCDIIDFHICRLNRDFSNRSDDRHTRTENGMYNRCSNYYCGEYYGRMIYSQHYIIYSQNDKEGSSYCSNCLVKKLANDLSIKFRVGRLYKAFPNKAKNN